MHCPSCVNAVQLSLTDVDGVEDAKAEIFLRPETAQGIFVNFKNVQRTSRKKVPFGIGQIGKSFRNEITPGNFTFRTIEFEQMEYQTFCKEGTDSDLYAYYKEYAKRHSMTELLFAENADKVVSMNLETDATTETSLQAVVSR